MGVVKLWSVDILMGAEPENTRRIFKPLADGGPKAAADQPLQAWRAVSWLGSGRRPLVSRPLSPNNMLDSPRYPFVVPSVNIALASPRFLWKVLLKRKFPLQDPINCDLDVRTL